MLRWTLAAALFVAVPVAFATEGVHEAASDLNGTPHSVMPHANGNVSIRSGSDAQRFTVSLDGLSETATVRVLLGDGHEGFHQVGELHAGASHRVLDLTTLDGGHLPLNVEHVEALSGRALHVRDAEGHVVLHGAVPHFAAEHDPPHDPPVHHDDPPVHHDAPHEPVHEQSDHHDETSGVDVHVEVHINPHPRHHHEALSIAMHHLPTHHPVHHDAPHHGTDAPHHAGDAPHHAGDAPAAAHHGPAKAKRVTPRAEVFIDDGDGNLVQADSARISRRGRAVLRYTTRRGRRLPLDAASLRDLAGRAFEVRVNGEVVASGNLPTF